MESIQSYVLFDLETTGLPGHEFGPTKITELSMVSVLRNHFDDESREIPRVKQKLTLLFHPAKHISPEAERITGLSNELLEDLSQFNETSFSIIDIFLANLPQPVCLISHNGNRFDFPLLNAHVKMINKSFTKDILCADTLLAFRELEVFNTKFWPRNTSSGDSPPNTNILLRPLTQTTAKSLNKEIVSKEAIESFFESIDEDEMIRCTDLIETIYSTPKNNRQEVSTGINWSSPRSELPSPGATPPRKPVNVKKQLFKQEKHSYTLGNVYKHLMSTELKNAHSAEADSIALLEVIATIGPPFHSWLLRNCKTLTSMCRR